MVVFPHAKINLGLNILRRRSDGYHDIDSIMVPVGWSDVLEVVPAIKEPRTTLECHGSEDLDCSEDDNLVIRAYNAVKSVCRDIPSVRIFLQKNIPSGAGLGGGSADAAYTVRALNTLFSLGLSNGAMAEIVSSIGADCPFFVYNSAMVVSGIGTTLRKVSMPTLSGLTIVICRPDGCHVSTAQAYAGVAKNPNAIPVERITELPPTQWRTELHNMFEDSVFPLYPAIADLKEYFYRADAVYSAMSGSGAAVYALFQDKSKAAKAFDQLKYRYKFITTL